MCTTKVSVSVKERIDFSAKDKKILDNLTEVIHHFNLRTQLRVAGGWVRDKLLGKECHDIDVVLDDMLGREFCEKVQEYLCYKGEVIKGICVINCNKEQSKHLETARMHIFGAWIDFVNLRAEDYSHGSRIPAMRFGTPEEDAFRRDLTINSLFYNISTDSVEDFTGRGIMDLRCGKIATPLPAKQTFLDDPLRVLRAIRFGSQFDFELDEELKAGAADNDVKVAITNKISRERIGHEIDQMMSGNQPVKAMAHISEFQLFWAVFNLPPEMQPSTPKECERNCVGYMDSAWCLLQLLSSSFSTDGQRRVFLYAALLFPFCMNKIEKMTTTVNYIFRTCLKLEKNLAQDVISLHIAAQKFSSLIPGILSLEDIEVEWKREIIDVPVTSKLRILCGTVMREIKASWRTALLLSLLHYPVNILVSNKSQSSNELIERKELIDKIEEAILKMGLDGIWELKPLVSGDEIKEITGEGRVVGVWKEKAMEWQLSYPYGCAKECRDWMMKTLVTPLGDVPLKRKRKCG